MAGRAFAEPGLARTLMAAHEHAALAGLVAIAVHGITLLGDTLAGPRAGRHRVPFVMDYEPLFTGLGIVGGYLAAALGLSFYARRAASARSSGASCTGRRSSSTCSRSSTRSAPGSDASEPWLRMAMAITGAPILYLLVVRMLPAPQRRRGTRRTGTSAIPGAS